MKVGYIRVSTAEQNEARQVVALEQEGAERLFIDKVSGKDTQRPQLQTMLSFVRDGDSVVIESISRLARNTRDLLEIVDQLREKGVRLVSLKESIDTETVSGKFMLTVFAAISELERGYILERQAEGIELAKANGVYKGRAPVKIDERRFAEVYAGWRANEYTAVKAMQMMGLKPSTFYRHVREYELRNGVK